MISPKQYDRWHPQLGKIGDSIVKEVDAAKARFKVEDAKQSQREDQTITNITKRATARSKSQASLPYAAPGEQGTLFDMKPTKKPEEKVPKETPAMINKQAKALHQQLIDSGALPPTEKMKPSRQVESFTTKPILPKAEGSQGTLMQPRRYRAV